MGFAVGCLGLEPAVARAPLLRILRAARALIEERETIPRFGEIGVKLHGPLQVRDGRCRIVDELIALGLYDPEADNAGDRLALLGFLLEQGASVDEMVEANRNGRLVGLAETA